PSPSATSPSSAPWPPTRRPRRWSRWRSRPEGSDRPPGADHAGVEAGQVEPAGPAGVLDLEAAVHDDVEAGGGGRLGHGLVPQAELEPQRLRPGGDGLL